MSDAITREEKLMQAIATGSPLEFEPITRKEKFLKKILEKVGGGGTGGGAFVVNFETTDGVVYTSDKTFEEIANAINDGMFVYGKAESDEGMFTYQAILFGSTFSMMGDYYFNEMTVTSDNNVESTLVQLTTN